MSSRRYPLNPMNAINPLHPMDDVNMIGKLADLKEAYYKQSLLLTALTELLMEKGMVSSDELLLRSTQLELLDFTHPPNEVSHPY